MEMTATKATFKKYPAYKDSGVEWLGEIPEHWETVRMKFLFRDVSEKNKPDAELLSVTQDQGVVPRTWVENRMVMPNGNLESFKFIQKGDFAISLRSFEGGLEYCHHDGIISPAYTVLKKKNGLIDGYYKYLFKSKSFISEIQTSVVGIREGKNISYFELSYSLLPIPSPEEQTAIANFLDDKTAKIDRAIAQKEKMIALLKERKQIIIQNAVTKGLNPNAKMKDSGVEWIGEVPEGWRLTPNKSLFKLIKNQVGKNSSKYDLLSLTLRGIIKRDMDNPEGKFPADFDTYQEVKKGDFVFCLFDVEETPRTVGLSEYDGMITGAYTVLRNFKEVNNTFLYYFYLNLDSRKELKYLYKGLRNTIPKDSFFSFKSLIPPWNEQNAIVNYIESQSAKIEKAIALQEQQIEKLKELKSTLIDSAVTGKIKVS